METVRVLVVDDELGMRHGVERTLRGFHISLADVEGEIAFDVSLAATGEEALERLRAEPVDLLLLDHKLPGIQGLDVLDVVSKEYRGEVLTVMITAYASIETAISATKRGAYDFLAKPFTPAELKATVTKAARHLMLQRQARLLARDKHKLRYQLISVVAHELKSPLAAIEGYLQLLQDQRACADPATRTHMIERSLVRLDGMRKLIFDLLDLTQIESGQRPRTLVATDLGARAAFALEGAKPAAETRRISLILDVPTPVVFSADPAEMDIILNNLVSNAVKYNRDNGTVTVSIRDSATQVTIAVNDTGIGMTAEECARLFGEFVRIRNVKTKDILGSGLGLSILKRLATLYHGGVVVVSEPDVGTTFTVTLAKLPLTEKEPSCGTTSSLESTSPTA
ncbi:MAG: response regulator [Polyangiaceae bacterium]|nr:response regulator [Polyangiaceae bacterium]